MRHQRPAIPAVAAGLLGLLVLVLAAAGCSSPQQAPVRPIPAVTGSPSPADGTTTVGLTTYAAERAHALPVLTGTDLSGSTLTIPAAGAVTVVNVWASWCQPCVAEMPKLRAVASRFADDDVVVLGVATRDKTAAAISFLSTTGFELPSLADPNGARAARWSSLVPAAAVPSTLLVDSDGHVRARWIGVVDETRLGDEICSILRAGKHTAASCPG